MNIQQMHMTFRTLGQQMGMQLVRGILPESIDVFINDVIIEKTQTELLQGVRTALQDSVSTQASVMSPINTFRSLYRTARYAIDVTDIDANTSKVSYYNAENGFHIINIPVLGSEVNVNDNEYKIAPMMFLGFSIEYDNTRRGNSIACRLIGSDVLETTLRDYCNGASFDAPIVCLSSIPIVKDGIEQLGVQSNEQLEIYTNCKNCEVKFLNIKYIKVPNVVKYDVDLSKCINCDLPEYTHYNIIEQAVSKYYVAIGSGSGTSQHTEQPRYVQQ